MVRVSKKLSVRILIAIQIFIFLIFLYTDIHLINRNNQISVKLKFITILLCFIITLLIGKDSYNKRDRFLVQLARFFTVIADYFLLIKEDFKLGIICFCIVQITYIIRHSLMEKKVYKNLFFLIFFLLISIFTLAVININNFDRKLLALGLIYAVFLLTSVYCGVSTLKRGKFPKEGALLISIGIILFLFCDINVGLFNIVGYIGLAKYEKLTGFFIWFFYFPSQLLLSLSGFKIQFLKALFKD
ncbi:lysoplasmalogenase family protein [Candidatus Clostridium radicumherbarum]|uniref:Lysoplasmalogenase family protein n=1 Tax=Candidatus Clostridium radicumherbarum TaxID=3381662 RepID=A0ABW8TR92_9CLOT